MWYNMVHRFLNSYYRDVYNDLFARHGYANVTEGGKTRIITRISELARDNAYQVRWTIENQHVRTESESFNEVKNMLSIPTLLAYNIQVIIDVPNIAYRIGRKIRIPGQCYLPEFTDVPFTRYPLKRVLDQVMTCATTYANSKNNGLMRPHQRNVELVTNRTLSAFDDQFCAWFHLVYCPAYMNISVANPLLWRSDTIDDDLVLTMYDSFDTQYPGVLQKPSLPYSLQMRPLGSTVRLPINGAPIFRPERVFEASYLYMCAAPPNLAYNGAQPGTYQIPQIDNSPYQVWFNKEIATNFLGFYIKELESRLAVCEAISMNVHLIYGTYLNQSISWLKDVFLRFARGGTPTAAGSVYIRSLFGLDTKLDNAINSMENSITTMLLKDPRKFCPSILLSRPDPNRLVRVDNNPVEFKLCIRGHIMKNANLILEQIFNENDGIIEIKTGVSISRAPLRGPVTITSRHTIPDLYIKYDHLSTTIVDHRTGNSVMNHRFTLSTLDRTTMPATLKHNQTILAPDVNTFIEILNTQLNPSAKKPFLTTLIRTYVPQSEFDVYYQLYEAGYLVFVVEKLKYTPTYYRTNFVNSQSSSAIPKSELLPMLHSIPDLSFTELIFADTAFTTQSFVPSLSYRNVLPIGAGPLMDRITELARGFNTTVAHDEFHASFLDVMAPNLIAPGPFSKHQFMDDGVVTDAFGRIDNAMRAYITVWYTIPFLQAEGYFSSHAVQAD